MKVWHHFKQFICFGSLPPLGPLAFVARILLEQKKKNNLLLTNFC